jgi:hypothetical protein
LVLDFSNVATISEAKAYFSEWSTNIQSQPELWQSGWSVDKIRNAIRDWAGKTGAAALHLDVQ